MPKQPRANGDGPQNGDGATVDPVADAASQPHDTVQGQRPGDIDTAATGVDQTLADLDQTSSDGDQTTSDSDQTDADSDQAAADRDQAASDRDLSAGLDLRDYQISRDMRQRTAAQRELTAQARLDAANLRDEIARSRDLVALARDRAAAARDAAMAQQDAAEQRAVGRPDFGVEILLRAAEQRRRAAEYRMLAAEHRDLAAQDRRAAATDRQRAAAERAQALADREALSHELATAETDSLTGARTRAAGLRDLGARLGRAGRAGQTLVVAYLDVVGLKALNDTVSHGAGDDLLRQLVELLRAHLRADDLIIRIGGDEFLCAIADLTEGLVRARFSAINAQLVTLTNARGIRAGFATSRSDESAAELVARADLDLVRRQTTSGLGDAAH